MVQRILFIILFVFTLQAVIAQKTNKYSIYLKTNPFSLLEPNGGPNIGVDFIGKSRVNLSFDVGGIFYNFYRASNNDVSKPRGVKFKPEIRYYLLEKNKDTRRFYTALEGMYNFANTVNFINTSVTDNLGNILFNKRVNYIEEKHVFGLAAKIGYRFNLQKNSDKFLLDLYWGFGARKKFINNTKVPTGVSIPTERRVFFDLNIDGIELPSMPFGLKLVYAIK